VAMPRTVLVVDIFAVSSLFPLFGRSITEEEKLQIKKKEHTVKVD
jgi:hypothetical protein